MYAVYKQQNFEAEYKNDDEVILYSSVRVEGFQNYIDSRGKLFPDYFSKTVKIEELDYLYKIHYEIQYKGHFFHITSAMNQMNIKNDWFELIPNIKQNELKNELDFKQINKLDWAKEIGRKDIEAIKIVETPVDIFKVQGSKFKILEGKDIDEFLASVKD
ncbi:Uncharacterised protein [Granulicatella adiacens]|jgi:hypothetical protein|uniref:hypothetical protein n=1 Tax=Granulicatella adiacens TaxID=46124 RepID=UPI00195B05F3|nr:hypothetical protein [Granulicatella adiacens]MCT2161070.1 hypothetical protein [Granulicatella adiacens]MDJ8840552.1 hypothetical protein [Salmonella enterica]UXY41392.1 hypothetical protein N8I82_09380 [Granulicatella adiacens]VTX51553.1 Uncharacterised protein [Granulicatella adiacens]